MILEFLAELILEIFVEGGMDVVADPKVSRKIRYPWAILLSLFFILIIGGLIVFGIIFFKDNTPAAILFLAVGIFLLIGLIVRMHKIRKEKMNTINQDNDSEQQDSKN